VKPAIGFGEGTSGRASTRVLLKRTSPMPAPALGKGNMPLAGYRVNSEGPIRQNLAPLSVFRRHHTRNTEKHACKALQENVSTWNGGAHPSFRFLAVSDRIRAASPLFPSFHHQPNLS